jgi:hypothetical protein
VPQRRESVARGEPPRYLMSLPVWIMEGRSSDPARARSEWDQARCEWARGAPTLDALNRLYSADFDAGPAPDPRARGHHTRGRA